MTNPAIANDSQDQSIEFDQGRVPVAPVETARPAALADSLRVMANVLRQFQEQRQSCLRHRSCAIGRNICDRDVPFAGGSQIDHISSCSRYANVSQSGQSLKMVPGEIGFIRQQNFSLRGAPNDLGRRTAVVNLTITKRL